MRQSVCIDDKPPTLENPHVYKDAFLLAAKKHPLLLVLIVSKATAVLSWLADSCQLPNPLGAPEFFKLNKTVGFSSEYRIKPESLLHRSGNAYGVQEQQHILS